MDLVLSHSRDQRPFKKYRKGKINSRVSPMCGNIKAHAVTNVSKMSCN